MNQRLVLFAHNFQCLQLIWPNFLMFTVSGKNAVCGVWRVFVKNKNQQSFSVNSCPALEKFSGFLLGNLRLSLDIFDSLRWYFGILQQSWGMFVSIRTSSEIIENCRAMTESSLIYQAKYYWLFWNRFYFILEKKNYCY